MAHGKIYERNQKISKANKGRYSISALCVVFRVPGGLLFFIKYIKNTYQLLVHPMNIYGFRNYNRGVAAELCDGFDRNFSLVERCGESVTKRMRIKRLNISGLGGSLAQTP